MAVVKTFSESYNTFFSKFDEVKQVYTFIRKICREEFYREQLYKVGHVSK